VEEADHEALHSSSAMRDGSVKHFTRRDVRLRFAPPFLRAALLGSYGILLVPALVVWRSLPCAAMKGDLNGIRT
jgi:hypothetical protein